MKNANSKSCLLITYCDGEVNFYETNTEVTNRLIEARLDKNTYWDDHQSEITKIDYGISLKLNADQFEKVVFVDLDFYAF